MVALDWEHVGVGAVGEDPARLVALGLLFGDVERATAADLSAAVFAGYLTGLRNVGWCGDTHLARLGYAAAAASFAIGIAGMVNDYVSSPDEAMRSQPEQWLDRPIEAVAEQWADAIYLLLDLADEARTLLPTF
jgi:hypothetical protein